MPDAPGAAREREFDADEVERLLEAVARLPADQRQTFLDSQCGDRPALIAEVLSLLENVQAADGFFRRLDAQLPRSLSELPEEADTGEVRDVGSRVGRYRVLERIGVGGMGTVYRAHDDALDRDVALKLVPRRLASVPDVRARFLVEARAAASLDHPNVCTIHEVGDAGDGRPFLAMTCYKGETLKDRLERGPLPVEAALDVAIQMVRGLGAAHARDIVHRDVKPGNVMLVDGGSVKILDFGIAKVAEATTTGPGATPGTVAYMSPEQAGGAVVDHRTDLWSTGVVLYEMLAGERPFSGGSDRVIFDAILHREPRPLEEVAPGTPPDLARIVHTLLRKPSAERYGSAKRLLRDLEGVTNRGQRRPTVWRGEFTRRARSAPVRFAAAMAAVLGLAVVGWAIWPESRAGSTLDPSVVAVMPFRVTGADASMGYLREGMVDLLVHRLGSAQRLRPVDARTLIDAWNRAGGLEGELSRGVALDLAERLGAGRLVLGEVMTLPGRITLSASLYDVATGRTGPALTETGEPDSLTALVDRLAVRLLSLDAAPSARLASITTGSLAALEPYLMGEAAYREGKYDEAALAFSRAVDRDSTFALAALMAARASDKVGPGTIGGDFAARAWRHRDRLGPRERTYLEVYGGARGFLGPSSPSHLLESLQRLVVLLPNDPDAWFMLGQRIPHSMARAGASDSVTLRHTAEAFRKALALDSSYMPGLTQLQLAEAFLGDTAAAFRLARQYLARVPDGLEADKLRCVLAGARGAGALRSGTLASFGPRVLGRCLTDLHGLYWYAHEARDTVAAYLDRRSRSPEVIALAGPMMYTTALDRGRPGEAKRHADAFRQAGLGWWSYHVSSAIRDALYSDRDSADAAVAAEEIAARLARGDLDLPEERRIEATCALAQWRMANGRAAAATAYADRLRALGRERETGPQVSALHCAALLEAWVAFQETASDLDARIAALDEMLIDGARDARLIRESAFLLARIHDARGQAARALEAIDRARITRPHYYESTYLRERGRLAAILGDTVGAITAYQRYLAMRSNPEPTLRAKVERVRSELERLGG